MIRLTRTFVRIDLPKASRAKFESFGHLAFKATETASKEYLKLKGTGTQVEVRDGSVVITSVIVVAAGRWVIENLARYESFSASVRNMVDQARAAGRLIKQLIQHRAAQEGRSVTSTRVSVGDIGRLDRINRAVGAGEMEPAEGMRQTLRILGEAGEDLTPSLIQELERSLGAPQRGMRWLEGAAELSRGGMPRQVEHYAAPHTPRHRGDARSAPRAPKPRKFSMRRDPGEKEISEDFNE